VNEAEQEDAEFIAEKLKKEFLKFTISGGIAEW